MVLLNKGEYMEKVFDIDKLFNMGPVVMIVWEDFDDGVISYISENVLDVLGYTQEEIINTEFRYAKIIHSDDLTRVKDEISSYLDKNIDNFSQQYRLKKKNGEYIYVFDFTRVIKNDNNDIVKIIGYFYDQTESVLLKQEIEKKHKRLELLIDSANLGTWVLNLNNKNVEYNDNWAKIIGYTLNELEPLSYDTWAKRCHPEDLDKALNKLEKYLNGESDIYEVEFRMLHKDGYYKWILSRGKVLEYDKDGNPLILYGVHIDIDEQKKIEEKLRRFVKYLNTAQAVSKTGSWHIDINTNNLWWSKETYRIFGLTENSFVNLDKFIERIHPDDRQKVSDALKQAIDGKVYDIDHRIIVGNEIKWVNEKAEVVFDDDKAIEAFGTVRDITLERQIYEKLKNENRLIELLFDLLPGFLWFVNKDKIIQKQNKNAKERFGSKIGEKCYMSIFCGKFLSEEHKKLLNEGIELPEMKCEFCIANESLDLKSEFSIEIEDRENKKFYKVWWIPLSENEYIHYLIDITEQKEAESYLMELAVKDHLTKIYNRRYITERLEADIELCKRANRTFSLIMFDIDHFKNINDTYGHNVGDNVLIKLTDIVKRRIRKIDIFARWGGEEFLIMLPESMLENARLLAENLRKLIEETDILRDRTVTCSFGVTEYYEGDTVDFIVKRADDCLYKAKFLGRNTVVSI
jgi:diguanylate cyclase (GGDEF)-like protein/PAS domain S-box-containing protein